MQFYVDGVGWRVGIGNRAKVTCLAAVCVGPGININNLQIDTRALARLCLQSLQENIALVTHRCLRLNNFNRQRLTILGAEAFRIAFGPARFIEKFVGKFWIGPVFSFDAFVVKLRINRRSDAHARVRSPR